MRTLAATTSRNGQPITKSVRKVRPSVVYCNEKYACNSDRAKASFTCEECRTNQCDECELRLHELTRYAFHDRRRISQVSSDQLCDPPGSVGCQSRNFADLVCEECNWRRYCFDCDLKIHRGRPLSAHRRVPVDSVTDAQKTVSGQNCVESLGCLPITANTSDLCTADHTNSMFTSLSNNDVSEYQSPAESVIAQPISDQSSLLFVSLPSVDDTLLYANSVQPVDNNAFNSSNSYKKAEDSSAAVMMLDSDSVKNDISNNSDHIQHLAASLQGSLLSQQYEDSVSKSFQVANHKEELQVTNADSFLQQLQCESETKVKVVSVFGKSGDGKSYMLNNTFFDGCEVFSTIQPDSSIMTTCTKGIWAAFDPVHEIILLDTEGWPGISASNKLHMRHLFKIFAVSDVVIVQTKSEHLHSDVFHFLASASSVYQQHVSTELASGDIFPSAAPAVIIFHETLHAEILANGATEPAEKILRSRFKDLGLNCDPIQILQYVGVRTSHGTTDFKNLLFTVKKLLHNKQLRAPKQPRVVFSAIKMLYDRFTGKVEMAGSLTSETSFCLTCRVQCLSCSAVCKLSMNHERDEISHATDRTCQYQKQYDNQDFLCKTCLRRGQEVIVVPKASAFESSSWFSLASFAWSGYVLECSNCGIIYRSRQHWFGNVGPEHSDVLKACVRHVWPGAKPPLQVNLGRHLLDSLTYVSDAVASASAAPAKVASSWVTDRIAPSYWVPNSELTHCLKCEKLFDLNTSVHHCRACGQGFCDKCSSKRRPVPERGWGSEPVRVCDDCFSTPQHLDVADQENVTRRVSEVIGSTVGTLSSVVSYPLAMLREAARPDYWTPDDDITVCCVCSKPFDSVRRVHHCRACGQGVCDKCSSARRNVPSRGWHYPVRVCVTCDANNSV